MAQNISLSVQSLDNRIRDLLAAGDLQGAARLLQEAHPANIADLLEGLDEDVRLQLFRNLQLDHAAEVLDEINTEATLDLVGAISNESIADIIEALPVDDAVDVLSELSSERAEQIISHIEPEEAREIEKFLDYAEDSAGRLVNSDIARLAEGWTVAQSLEFLREVGNHGLTLAYLYVVDREGRLIGLVPLQKLVTERPETPIKAIMKTDVVFVEATADREEAARLVAHYDFFAIPVVDARRRLLGVITHDDVVDILQEEFTEDVQRQGGSQPLEGQYLATPIRVVFQKRVGWLLVLFLTEMLTGTVMRVYEHELQSAVALAFFVPLLIGTGGNSGSQTTSTIVRAIAMGEVQLKDVWRLLWHELRAGLLLGIVMAAIGFGRGMLWNTGVPLALTVAIALFAIVLWANIIGAVLPPLAARLKVDPAVISGPVMSTLVDATGLIIYFSLARWIIGL